jgi:hypothetical protein
MSSVDASKKELAKQRQVDHNRRVAELLKAHYADENARKNGVAQNGGNSESSGANTAGAADVDGDAGVFNNDASQRQSRHDRMVAELLKDYYATHGASEALFIERTVAGLNNGAKPPLANAADAMSPADIELLLAIETDSEDDDADEGDDAVRSYVHPYVWKCVDDGDQQGCGAVMRTNKLIQHHRQSQCHADGIALGSPDLSKGIRANGWNCVDVGDIVGCGEVLPMINQLFRCATAHKHLTSGMHLSRLAERRGATLPLPSKRKSKAPAPKEPPGAMSKRKSKAPASKDLPSAMTSTTSSSPKRRKVDNGNHSSYAKSGSGVSAAAFASKTPRKSKLSETAKRIMRTFFLEHYDHPFATWEQKANLSKKTGMSLQQIGDWLTNTRKREWNVQAASQQASKVSRSLEVTANSFHVMQRSRAHDITTMYIRSPAKMRPAVANDNVELSSAFETDGEDDEAVEDGDSSVLYVHPYEFKCVDDGDQQGCGAVMKNDVQTHRQTQNHADGIALGAPDLSKGILE